MEHFGRHSFFEIVREEEEWAIIGVSGATNLVGHGAEPVVITPLH